MEDPIKQQVDTHGRTPVGIYYNELFAQEIMLGVEERVRIKMRMETTKDELCVDFREMCTIIEHTLGIQLPDHYKLYEVCGN
jgi:hypothetical protein